MSLSWNGIIPMIPLGVVMVVTVPMARIVGGRGGARFAFVSQSNL